MTPYEQLRYGLRAKRRALICGTGPSLDVLSDKALVEHIAKTCHIFCVNTAHHYFDTVDVLFIGPRCDYARTVRSSHFDGKAVVFYVGSANSEVPGVHILVTVRNDHWPAPELSDDITKPLPFGPTTILDSVVPTAMFCGMKELYFIGAEYARTGPYRRFYGDSRYRDGNARIGFAGEIDAAHVKWKLWKDYFSAHGIVAKDLSLLGELPFDKASIADIGERA